MENTVESSAIRSSLLNREVYCVCFPQRDSLDVLRGEFAAARKRFFTGGRKAVRVGKNETVKGFDGKLWGKLSKRSLYWKKTAQGASGSKKLSLEEVFDQKGGYVLVNRDFRGIIVSRIFFNRNLAWIKSEYYEPWDAFNAQVLLKPMDASDTVERFDWDVEAKRYNSTLLHPVPYLSGTAEQSILTARFGEFQVIVSTAEGTFGYCPEEEAKKRIQALSQIHDGTIVLMPAWEVKNGALTGEEGEEETRVTFTSLEEYARIEPAAEKDPEPAPEKQEKKEKPKEAEQEEIPEFTPAADLEGQDNQAVLEMAPGVVEASSEKKAPAPEEASQQINAEKTQIEKAASQKSPDETEKPQQPSPQLPIPGGGYQGSIRDGKITGRGRMDQQNGLTAYDGEWEEGKRQGFGSYYYKNGNLCYAGFWKNDKKDGLGVSFRDSDHALHIANWHEGEPGGFVSLFDKNGNLRYGGRIEEGKKQGAGVSFNGEDGTVFVGKWIDGENTGVGSLFDREGNLLYYGSWKDGRRNGHGTEFDPHGGIVFDGEWKDGKYHNGILYQKQGGEGNADPETSIPNWDL